MCLLLLMRNSDTLWQACCRVYFENMHVLLYFKDKMKWNELKNEISKLSGYVSKLHQHKTTGRNVDRPHIRL